MSHSQSATIPWAWIKAARDIVRAEPRQQPTSMPVELLPWLYLSDMPSVLKVERLQALGITAVLTTNKIVRQEDLWNMTAKLAEHDIAHGYAGGVDIVGYQMIKYHWLEAAEFIEESLQNDGKDPKIVIHCAAGTNRSALMAGAAMLLFRNTDEGDDHLTFLDVIRILKQRRGFVLNNVWFIRQLAEFAQTHNKLGPKPDGYSNEPLRQTEMVF